MKACFAEVAVVEFDMTWAGTDITIEGEWLDGWESQIDIKIDGRIWNDFLTDEAQEAIQAKAEAEYREWIGELPYEADAE